MNLAAYLTTRPEPIPVGLGRVHRLDDDEQDAPEEMRPASNERQPCLSCGYELPMDAFYFRSQRGNYMTSCKKCQIEQKRQRRAAK